MRCEQQYSIDVAVDELVDRAPAADLRVVASSDLARLSALRWRPARAVPSDAVTAASGWTDGPGVGSSMIAWSSDAIAGGGR